jgi:hypothetical protein
MPILRPNRFPRVRVRLIGKLGRDRARYWESVN